MLQGPEASASFGSLLDMPNFKPHLRLLTQNLPFGKIDR